MCACGVCNMHFEFRMQWFQHFFPILLLFYFYYFFCALVSFLLLLVRSFMSKSKQCLSIFYRNEYRIPNGFSGISNCLGISSFPFVVLLFAVAIFYLNSVIFFIILATNSYFRYRMQLINAIMLIGIEINIRCSVTVFSVQFPELHVVYSFFFMCFEFLFRFSTYFFLLSTLKVQTENVVWQFIKVFAPVVQSKTYKLHLRCIFIKFILTPKTSFRNLLCNISYQFVAHGSRSL